MTAVAKSIYYFGIYLLILGITLTVFPNFMLSTFQIAETTEVWIRVLGAIVFNIGLYYIFMSPVNNPVFITLTIYTRALVLLWFVVFVAMDWASSRLILFGLVDVVGAGWTYFTARKTS